jgi:hypothetical protein
LEQLVGATTAPLSEAEAGWLELLSDHRPAAIPAAES